MKYWLNVFRNWLWMGHPSICCSVFHCQVFIYKKKSRWGSLRTRGRGILNVDRQGCFLAQHLIFLILLKEETPLLVWRNLNTLVPKDVWNAIWQQPYLRIQCLYFYTVSGSGVPPSTFIFVIALHTNMWVALIFSYSSEQIIEQVVLGTKDPAPPR